MIAAATVSPIGAGVFFRSMNRKIPHALGEGMREISWLCLRSIPSAGQHEVDQGGHIVDVDIALQVAVGIGHVDTCGITSEHIVDQGGHIVDVDMAVTVYVATLVFGTVGKEGHLLAVAPTVWVPSI